MKSRSIIAGVSASAGMLVLILDPRTALEGMRSGIGICFQTLIPSLFPFFVLSIFLTGNLMGSRLKLLQPVCRTLGIPPGAESLLITGFLGGYPVGAQSVAQFYAEGKIPREKAARLLAFCSNAGPAFLFGVVSQAFDSLWTGWLLWGIHIASAILVGLVMKDSHSLVAVKPSPSAISLSGSLRMAIGVMAQVCGWVVLFRMVLCYLDRWFLWLLPKPLSMLAAGTLELSNGCLRLRELESEGIRFVAASALTAFGGICVELQTRSVTEGLSLRYYHGGKLLQMGLSLLISGILFYKALSPVFFVFSCMICLFSLYILRKKEKNSSIPAAVGV